MEPVAAAASSVLYEPTFSLAPLFDDAPTSSDRSGDGVTRFRAASHAVPRSAVAGRGSVLQRRDQRRLEAAGFVEHPRPSPPQPTSSSSSSSSSWTRSVAVSTSAGAAGLDANEVVSSLQLPDARLVAVLSRAVRRDPDAAPLGARGDPAATATDGLHGGGDDDDRGGGQAETGISPLAGLRIAVHHVLTAMQLGDEEEEVEEEEEGEEDVKKERGSTPPRPFSTSSCAPPHRRRNFGHVLLISARPRRELRRLLRSHGGIEALVGVAARTPATPGAGVEATLEALERIEIRYAPTLSRALGLLLRLEPSLDLDAIHHLDVTQRGAAKLPQWLAESDGRDEEEDDDGEVDDDDDEGPTGGVGSGPPQRDQAPTRTYAEPEGTFPRDRAAPGEAAAAAAAAASETEDATRLANQLRAQTLAAKALLGPRRGRAGVGGAAARDDDQPGQSADLAAREEERLDAALLEVGARPSLVVLDQPGLLIHDGEAQAVAQLSLLLSHLEQMQRRLDVAQCVVVDDGLGVRSPRRWRKESEGFGRGPTGDADADVGGAGVLDRHVAAMPGVGWRSAPTPAPTSAADAPRPNLVAPAGVGAGRGQGLAASHDRRVRAPATVALDAVVERYCHWMVRVRPSSNHRDAAAPAAASVPAPSSSRGSTGAPSLWRYDVTPSVLRPPRRHHALAATTAVDPAAADGSASTSLYVVAERG